jgi:hypothetical protein
MPSSHSARVQAGNRWGQGIDKSGSDRRRSCKGRSWTRQNKSDGLQGRIESGSCAAQLIEMDLVAGDFRYLRAQLLQYVGQQPVVDVNVNGFPNVLGPGMFEDEQQSGGIHRSIKARRALESPAIELVGIFESDFCLVGDRLCGHIVPRTREIGRGRRVAASSRIATQGSEPLLQAAQGGTPSTSRSSAMPFKDTRGSTPRT